MSGTLITLLDMTTYNFDDVADNETIVVPLTQNIDISRHANGALLVRVHSKDVGTDGEITVGLLPVLPSPQDPSKIFESSTPLASVSIGAGTTTSPALLIDDLSTPLGGYCTLKLAAIQPSQGSGVNLQATISVELSLKN